MEDDEEYQRNVIRFWVEWRSWALPLRIGMWAGYIDFEVQVGPFGFTWYRA